MFCTFVYCLLFSAIASSTADLNSAIVALGSFEPKTDVPATSTFEPENQRLNHRIARRRLTGFSTLTHVSRSDTTIDLDVFAREPLSQVLDFLQTLWHEFLTTLTRSDSHDEQEIGRLSKRLGDDV